MRNRSHRKLIFALSAIFTVLFPAMNVFSSEVRVNTAKNIESEEKYVYLDWVLTEGDTSTAFHFSVNTGYNEQPDTIKVVIPRNQEWSRKHGEYGTVYITDSQLTVYLDTLERVLIADFDRNDNCVDIILTGKYGEWDTICTRVLKYSLSESTPLQMVFGTNKGTVEYYDAGAGYIMIKSDMHVLYRYMGNGRYIPTNRTVFFNEGIEFKYEDSKAIIALGDFPAVLNGEPSIIHSQDKLCVNSIIFNDIVSISDTNGYFSGVQCFTVFFCVESGECGRFTVDLLKDGNYYITNINAFECCPGVFKHILV